MQLRGWQRYVLERSLEHDEAGDLLWPTVIVTVARQSGKSYLARGLCMWRMHEGRDLFGAEQTILHVANKRGTAMEVMRPAGHWATAKYGKRSVKWGNNEAGIETPDGDRWIVHAANDAAGVGFSIDMGFVDEAWKIQRSVVDDAISPTMSERPNPQLYLVSTAGDSTSDLLLSYRQRALDRLADDDPGSVLLLEWSSPPDADVDLVETWKWASPEWSERREKYLTEQHAKVDQESFQVQYLNQWIVKAGHWLKQQVWEACQDEGRDLPANGTWIVALESDFDGLGHAVAIACQDDDGRIVIRVSTHRTIAECDEKVAQLRAAHPAMIVHATPSYIDRMRQRIDGIVGQREAVAATQALLDAWDRRMIAHDGNATLREHFAQSTIARRQAGWVVSAPMGQAGVYAARAVMFAVWQASKVQKPAPAIYSRAQRVV
jgi:phage terminase large subunit-like protein